MSLVRHLEATIEKLYTDLQQRSFIATFCFSGVKKKNRCFMYYNTNYRYGFHLFFYVTEQIIVSLFCRKIEFSKIQIIMTLL